jgi:hypothetical protein
MNVLSILAVNAGPGLLPEFCTECVANLGAAIQLPFSGGRYTAALLRLTANINRRIDHALGRGYGMLERK